MSTTTTTNFTAKFPIHMRLNVDEQRNLALILEMRLHDIFFGGFKSSREERIQKTTATLEILNKLRTSCNVEWVYREYYEKLIALQEQTLTIPVP